MVQKNGQYARKSNQSYQRGVDTSTKRKINFKRKQNENISNVSFLQDEQNRNTKHRKSRNIHSLKSAQIEYHNVRQKKLERREQAKKRQEEIKIALDKYNQKKKIKNWKLLAKTSKGQPIMKNRIELLLEKIQSSVVK